MHEVIEILHVAPDAPLEVWFEPWAVGMTFSPKSVVEVRATSPRLGNLEIVWSEKGISVYAWSGCTLKVFVDGDLVDDFGDIIVPDVPMGMDMKGFTTSMFGEPTMGEQQPVIPMPKPQWWHFWS